jgi:hypothetical protein
VTVTLERPVNRSTEPPAWCGLDWCADNGKESHLHHTTAHSTVRHVTTRQDYRHEFGDAIKIPDSVMIWIDSIGIRPAALTLWLSNGDGTDGMAARFTRAQVTTLAEHVLFWLACLDGVKVDDANLMSIEAVAKFEAAVAA